MSVGYYSVGDAVAVGAIKEEDASATFDPYAAVFDNPQQDLIILLEIEVRQGTAE